MMRELQYFGRGLKIVMGNTLRVFLHNPLLLKEKSLFRLTRNESFVNTKDWYQRLVIFF